MQDIKKLIKECLAKGKFTLTLHAAERMSERYVFEADIKSCGKTAKKIEFQPNNNTWKVLGKDLDGDRLTVICTFKDGVLIVTVY